MFLEKRVYQGSSGVVYPHPVIETIADEKTMQEYNAVFLENDYLQIMILPELGGRVQRAYDKVRKRDFVYYNQVVKPALVGLAGPWISGGIEFNWPQHHRPSTFSPVDHTIEHHADGSKTVWVNEQEIMFRTKGMAGFTLHPGKAYLEIKGRLFNRSPFPQTFLWWANPAVKVNEHYQSVFPPDVYAVFDHGKRDVSDFPIATGTYYKVNYAPGTDISRYHTIPVPTSYMAIRSQFDFMGCYEHDTQAGMLHVADHHLSPGKKQWTWGNGDFGFAWDRNLTDEDGPYIELMTGVFTDNQPDFSWLQPNEGKTFEQYFMPYALIGAVKNATKEAMLNMEWTGNQLSLKVYATGVYNNARVELYKAGELLNQFTADLSPAAIFETTITIASPGKPADYELVVADATGAVLVSYQPAEAVDKEIPAAATPALAPAAIEQVEDLYLNGLHLEQYRHATYNPIDYYEEGLRRSPGDVRCNNAMGLLLLRRGQFAKAEPYLRRAIATLTKRNPNPYDGEPYYNLGWSLVLQGRREEAYEAFYKATWNDAWQHSGFFQLARIATAQGRYAAALALVEKSLVRNYHSHTARHLKAILLRKLGRSAELETLAQESLSIDLFNYGVRYEQYLQLQQTDPAAAAAALQQLLELMRQAEQNYLELALDYAHAGCYTEAIGLLEHFRLLPNASPLLPYYQGWLQLQLGENGKASQSFKAAARQSAAICFPNRIEEILILSAAIQDNPADGQAAYYLGNLWYDKRQYPEAIQCWERAVQATPHFATPYRNLSLAYFNKQQHPEKALQALEQAFRLDPTDARVLMELDQLYRIMGREPAERLAKLEQFLPLVESRDDLYLERVTLYNTVGQFEKAKALMAARRFHPWEGGEGKVVGQYLYAHIELAKKALAEKRYADAIDLLTAAETYPEDLGEGKLYGAQENDLHYLLGCAQQGLGNAAAARSYFEKATVGIAEPVQAIYYNDPQPDKILYQALAWQQLGQPEKASTIFRKFVQFGEAHLDHQVTIDYFAVSLPDMLVFDLDLNRRNRLYCQYLMGLGWLGLGETQKGLDCLAAVLLLDKNHQGAAAYQQMVSYFKTNEPQQYAHTH
ncbi:MAG: DUF5107 domain-containing protein [Candidatus Pseudobacter hemicellulosilyticus]|uniref:DUF5107 domain-containing protein n=1 Tax=Candidatus Pseudobacter hemicellulosilyticus TaxID=3121375 RepID=A0AAJ5WS34_9BACT|nr:MAG: DUF5107 domain-containing protein [Pseudobacter sp.]